jgi:ubiquitin C
MNPFQIYIKHIDGQTHTVSVNNKTTVDELKYLVCAKTNDPPDEQRFIYAGKQLEDDHTLEHYNISQEATLYLILRLRGD